MLNADKAVRMNSCPRCGLGGLEVLSTHTHCVNCNYAETSDSEEMLSLPDWVVALLSGLTKKKQKKRKCQGGPVLALAL